VAVRRARRINGLRRARPTGLLIVQSRRCTQRYINAACAPAEKSLLIHRFSLTNE
jgi:hypothetical protein